METTFESVNTMAGNWQTTHGFIKKASVLQSTGAERDKGDAFVEQLKAGIKNVSRPFPNHKEGYVGAVLALEFAVGPKTIYYDILVEEPEFAKTLEMLNDNYLISDKAQATDDDIFLPAWGIWVIPNKQVFIKVKVDVKEGKTYVNVMKIGPTKADVDFQPKMAEGFAPANPFAGMTKPTTPIARAPVAPTQAIAPRSDALFGSDDSNVSAHEPSSEIPF